MNLPPEIEQLFQNYLNTKAKYNMRMATYEEVYAKHQLYLIAYNEHLEQFWWMMNGIKSRNSHII